MPNVAIGKKKGTIGFCASEEVSDDDVEQAFSLVSKLGYCIMLEEEHLDTIVALSGSGIAYLTHILGVFIAEGEKAGMDREEVPITDHNALAVELETFVSAVSGGNAADGATGEHGLQAVEIAERIVNLINDHNARHGCKPLAPILPC